MKARAAREAALSTFGDSTWKWSIVDFGPQFTIVHFDRRRALGLDQATLALRAGVSRYWIMDVVRLRALAEQLPDAVADVRSQALADGLAAAPLGRLAAALTGRAHDCRRALD